MHDGHPVRCALALVLPLAALLAAGCLLAGGLTADGLLTVLKLAVIR